jgi:putative ABC transport system permease protein
MIKDYFLLAFKNVRHRGLRSWLTILGVFIGIAAVVALISMGQGLNAAITGQFGALSVDKLTIQNKGTGFGPPGSTVVEKLTEQDIKIIESVNGVNLVIPRLIRVAKVEYNDVATFSYVADMPDNKEASDAIYETFTAETAKGKLLEPGDYGKILLGNDYLKSETFGKDIDVGRKIKIEGKEFEVVGILEKSSTFTINLAIMMNHEDLSELLNTGDEYDLLVAQVQNPDQIDIVAKEIERKLRNDRHEKIGEESFSVQTPLQALGSVKTILNIINIIVIGIAAISLFVGGVGIANTMYTSVLERTKEIGVMKAIGARNKDILSIFLIESGLLGLVGGVAGATAGLVGAISVSKVAAQFLGENLFIISISWPLLIGAISFSFFVGIVSGILPAFQASKLKIVDALRS